MVVTSALSITNQNDALELIRDALEGQYQNDILDISFEGWPVLEFNISGDRYNGTLPTSLMKALVDFQAHLNRAYAQTIYGRNANSLRFEERDALEIVVKVEQGSTQIVADLGSFFSEMAKNCMEKMTGKQIAYTVGGIAFMVAASSGLDSYLSHQEKTQAQADQHELMMELAKDPKLADFAAAQEQIVTNVLKSVADANSVSINQNAPITKDQIEEITRTERQKSEVVRLDAEYQISLIKRKPDSYRIDIVRVDDGEEFSTELFKGHLTLQEMQLITDAFVRETPIHLAVVGRVRGDIVTNAHIAGILDGDHGTIAQAAIPANLARGLGLDESDSE